MNESFIYNNADIIGIPVVSRYFTANSDHWEKHGWGVLEITDSKVNIWYDLKGNIIIIPPERDDRHYTIGQAINRVDCKEWKEVADRLGSEL